MIQFSTALRNAWLGTGSLQSLLANCTIHVFKGPVPADADAAIDATAGELVPVKNGASGGTFANPTNGVLQKTAAETWTGTIAATGDATFYRLTVGTTDTGATAAGASDYRVQGSIGIDASFDLKVASAALTSGGSFPIDDFEIVLPA